MSIEENKDSNASGLIFGSVIALVIYGFFGSGVYKTNSMFLNVVYIIVGIALAFMLCSGVYGLIFQSNKNVEIVDLENIESSYTELNKNYNVLRRQTQLGFVFSIITMLIGLLVIIYGVGNAFYYNKNIDNLSAISGIIMEFVSGTSFFIYKINFNRLNSISNELFKMWKVIIALNKINDFEGQDKTEMTKKLIENLIK
ncbi:MAG: hypothetical protein CVU90_15665 [Firmicutes bacterium HGW-Firmicutes-15]|nr:MAG: hypothetical protein CVU90_15665 [Firmicutes bacterium HGW-Firmicutes-15]